MFLSMFVFFFFRVYHELRHHLKTDSLYRFILKKLHNKMNTVKPVYNNQSRDPKIMAVVYRRSLFRGSFVLFMWKKGLHYSGRSRQVVVSSGLTVLLFWNYLFKTLISIRKCHHGVSWGFCGGNTICKELKSWQSS